MTTLRAPIVGMHFRPPAKLLVQVLPAGTTLTLEPEPENPYDPLAIRVLVAASAIPESQYARLEAELPGMGLTIDEVLGAEAPWQLGYVCASTNVKQLAKCPGTVGNADVGALAARCEDFTATLAFDPSGWPLVIVEGEPQEAGA